jgi:hypothetical protein
VAGRTLRLEYPDSAALARDFEGNLKKGRAFIAGATELRERDACRVAIVHPESGAEHVLEAEAVWLNPDSQHPGVGVSFTGFDAARRDALLAFIEAVAEASADEQVAFEPPPDSLADSLGPSSSGAHRNLYDRMRSLSPDQRGELAREGSLPERVALERCFGGSVWESLLQNPQLTTREVARFAKSSSLPGTLVNLIVNNRAWLADSGVQQALLANPRVGGAQLERVLRALPQSEIARVATQTSYRLQVRTAAKRLIVR